MAKKPEIPLHIKHLTSRLVQTMTTQGRLRTRYIGKCQEKSCGTEYPVYSDPKIKNSKFCKKHRSGYSRSSSYSKISHLIIRTERVTSASGNQATHYYGICAFEDCGKEYNLYLDPRAKNSKFCHTHRHNVILGVRCLNPVAWKYRKSVTRVFFNGRYHEWFGKCPTDGCINEYRIAPRKPGYAKLCSHCAHGRIPYRSCWNSFKVRTKQTRGFDFSLTFKEYVTLSKGAHCFYCKVLIVRNVYSRDGLYLDRLDSSKGYVRGNCVPCCTSCNKIKGGWLHQKEMEIVALMRLGKEREAVRSLRETVRDQKSYNFRVPRLKN
jgi:hypothetical protein